MQSNSMCSQQQPTNLQGAEGPQHGGELLHQLGWPGAVDAQVLEAGQQRQHGYDVAALPARQTQAAMLFTRSFCKIVGR